MANPEHLAILKQGVKVWNEWMYEEIGPYPDLRPDLKEADLSGMNLYEVNFYEARLNGVNLSRSNLKSANLIYADLTKANLEKADLSGADLGESELVGAKCNEANCGLANFSSANLINVDFDSAFLLETNFSDAKLDNANVSRSILGKTIFGNVDLSNVKGLETARHGDISIIGIETLVRSKGNIPEIFLREAGVPEPFITNLRSLISAMSPIQFFSFFISYSSKDDAFARRLRADLMQKGVSCYFAPHDMRPGTVISRGIDEAIRVHDKLLLIISEQSLESAWVQREVESAEHEEMDRRQDVLFPIRIDDSVLESKSPLAIRLRRRHIADFMKWKDHDEYQQAFDNLLKHMQAETQK